MFLYVSGNDNDLHFVLNTLKIRKYFVDLVGIKINLQPCMDTKIFPALRI